MNFEFMPYKLNTDISDFKDILQYISSNNGVDLYRAKEGFIRLLLGFPVLVTNLYFFEGNLITVYCHLQCSKDSFEQLKRTIEGLLNKAGISFTDEDNTGLYWKSEYDVLAIAMGKDSNKIYLYYSGLKYSVF